MGFYCCIQHHVYGGPEISSCATIQNDRALEIVTSEVMDEWQSQWEASPKGKHTFAFIPDIRVRMYLPLWIDHYVCHPVGGHGDFNDSLHSLMLVNLLSCECGLLWGMVDHFLYKCPTHQEPRAVLER